MSHLDTLCGHGWPQRNIHRGHLCGRGSLTLRVDRACMDMSRTRLCCELWRRLRTTNNGAARGYSCLRQATITCGMRPDPVRAVANARVIPERSKSSGNYWRRNRLREASASRRCPGPRQNRHTRRRGPPPQLPRPLLTRSRAALRRSRPARRPVRRRSRVARSPPQHRARRRGQPLRPRVRSQRPYRVANRIR